MGLKNIKINAEIIFLIVVFIIFLWTGYGVLSGHVISHDSPIGYFSSDAVQDTSFVEGIKETGNYKYFPPYMSAGFNDTLAWYAPVIIQDMAMFSHLSGLEAYDALIFMVYFFAVVSALIMYFIIRKYNKNIAILSVPLMSYIFFGKFYSAFLLGQWGYTMGCMFMIAAFWAVTRLSEKKSYFLLALFIAGIVCTHPPEIAFIMGFIGIYFILNLITRKASKSMFKKLFLAGIISLVIASYFILVPMMGVASHATSGGLFKIGEPITDEHYGYPGVYIKFFGLSAIFVIFGMILSLKNIKKLHVSFLIGFFMLFVGYSNYLGG
ncbi:glycosyltransferase family 39 protein, partial [Candidatus Woesearchaeota archaeon]|nr:glycosyltransferase family 39 protein [Candidatus Woesearchaeota archaeon]